MYIEELFKFVFKVRSHALGVFVVSFDFGQDVHCLDMRRNHVIASGYIMEIEAFEK